MGAFLDKPKTEKNTESGSGNGLRYGVSSMQGWRVEMEDAHCAQTSLAGKLCGWSFFAVFDGHAGARVSEQCATELLKTITQTDEFKKIDPEMAPSVEEIHRGIREGFLSLDEEMRRHPEVESGADKSGSTAVCCLVSPAHIFFANCGDSRALLIREGKVAFSTVDHKPGNPAEKQRIVNAGGSVMIQRVNGSLAVSRSLGDYDYKNVEGKGPTEQLVSPEPEITEIDRDSKADELIILACDGVWDVMSNDDMGEFLIHRLSVSEDLTNICNEVIDTCLYKGSRDNMSVVLVSFENCPGIQPEIQQKDQELDEKLTQHIKEFVENSTPGEVELNSLLINIQALALNNYPPGGLAAKRQLIEKVFYDCVPEHRDNEKPSTELGDDIDHVD